MTLLIAGHIRFVARAPVKLVVLVYEARRDGRSWFAALQSDLEWLKLCDAGADFTISKWFSFPRGEPCKARALVRKICDSQAARSTVLAKRNVGVIAFQLSHSCQCGKSFASKVAFDGHRATVHGMGAAGVQIL